MAIFIHVNVSYQLFSSFEILSNIPLDNGSVLLFSSSPSLFACSKNSFYFTSFCNRLKLITHIFVRFHRLYTYTYIAIYLEKTSQIKKVGFSWLCLNEMSFQAKMAGE